MLSASPILQARRLRRSFGFGGALDAGNDGGVVGEERFPRGRGLHGFSEIIGSRARPYAAEQPARRRRIAPFGIQVGFSTFDADSVARNESQAGENSQDV